MRFSGSIILSVLLFFSDGCQSDNQPEPLSKEQLEVFDYLPRQSEFVLYMNANQLRQTSFWVDYFKKSLNSYQNQNWLGEFESATGTGINNGVAEVYLAASWAGKNIFVIRFDKNYDRIKEYFNNSYSSDLINGKKIYSEKSNPLSQFYFISDSLLLIANNIEFISSITSNEFNSLKENAEMMTGINNVKRKEYYWMVTDQVTYVSSLIEQLIDLKGNEDARKMFGSIKNISLSVSFEDDVELSSLWELSNEKDAFLLSVAMRSAISNNLPGNMDDRLKEIIKKIKIKRDDNIVSLDLTLVEKDINELQNLSKEKNMNEQL